MKKRILTAVVLLPVLFGIVLFAPPWATVVLIGFMAALATWELLHHTALVRHGRMTVYAAAAAFLTVIWRGFGADPAWALFGVLLLYLTLFTEYMLAHDRVSFRDVALCMTSGLLIPLLLSALARIRLLDDGQYYIIIPFVIAFLSDSGAYFAGLLLGKHKLAPTISPHKTVEGLIGGVLAAVLGMVGYAVVVQLVFRVRVRYAWGGLYGVIGALGGVFGDLSMSVIKRETGIKDYGTIIPGHGGVLDRFDSMLVIAPVCELLLTWIPVAVRV